MKLFLIILFNLAFIFSITSYAHDNLEQHAIAHVYPKLELKYKEKEETYKCKMGLLERSKCRADENNNTIE